MNGQVLHVGRVGAEAFVTEFCRGRSVVLVTGGESYAACGASAFLDPLLPGVRRLAVKTPNPRVEEIEALRRELGGVLPDAFVAVGGGTPMDTAKLLDFSATCGCPVRELPERGECPSLRPLLAIPTTAGTGAEATRFAVCYEGEVKHSVDFPALRPTHVLILPELSASQTAYQRACTNFDAYAQAVESLWARGATEESVRHARKALELIAGGNWPEASYWAGRAIDISRTTAAHALSYYLTSHYGVPHGHAVYMVFPYVCRANGRSEFARSVPELTTLAEFAASRGMAWEALVGELLAHVNAKRLNNNPCPIDKRHFQNRI